MGRPKKKPSAKQLAGFDPFMLLHDEVADILIQSKVTGKWNCQDVQLLIYWFMLPAAFNATEKKPDTKRINNALALAEMFSRSPDELIAALPKIRKKILSYFANPMKRVMLDESIRQGWLKAPVFDQWRDDLWENYANVLAGKDSTSRTIENARAKICKIVTP